MKRWMVPILAFAITGGAGISESLAKGGSFLNVPPDERGLTLAEMKQRERRLEKQRQLKIKKQKESRKNKR